MAEELTWLRYPQALGPGIVALVVGAWGIWIANWQAKIAAEKLRHDLYDRRFAIYKAFQELINTVDLDTDDTIIKKINACRQDGILNAQFLLSDHTIILLEKILDDTNKFMHLRTQQNEIRSSDIKERSENRKNQQDIGGDIDNNKRLLAHEFNQYLNIRDFRG